MPLPGTYACIKINVLLGKLCVQLSEWHFLVDSCHLPERAADRSGICHPCYGPASSGKLILLVPDVLLKSGPSNVHSFPLHLLYTHTYTHEHTHTHTAKSLAYGKQSMSGYGYGDYDDDYYSSGATGYSYGASGYANNYDEEEEEEDNEGDDRPEISESSEDEEEGEESGQLLQSDRNSVIR